MNTGLSKKLFDKIEAPRKAFYTFEHSAHSPMFEEPDRFISIIAENVLVKVAESAKMQ